MEEERSYSLKNGAVLRLYPAPEGSHGIILICPGGAYRWLSPREAEPVANAFLAGGWQAAVLEYTIRGEGSPRLGNLPLEQLGEAVSLLRDTCIGKPIVVCGFSAGGHLAASLGVHWQRLGLPRPDGLILCYPVITAGEYSHQESIDNLAPAAEADIYSLEKYAGTQVPPVFIWHTMADPLVSVQNSLLFVDALQKAGARPEVHLFPNGTHGLSLATPEVEEPEKDRYADAHIAQWFPLCLAWLDSLGGAKDETAVLPG